MKQITYQEMLKLQKEDKVEVLMGCSNKVCFCNYSCKKVIGHYQNGVFIPCGQQSNKERQLNIYQTSNHN